MTISETAWKKYVERLGKLNRVAARKMKAFIEKNGTDNPKILIDYAYLLATKYGEASAALSATMYDALAEVSKVALLSAEPAATATYGEVAKAINGTLKTGNEDIVSDAVGTLVKQAGADTMLQNANRPRDRKVAEFAWIPSGGDTCAMCLTIASNGWRPISKEALNGNHADHIHANCDCNFAIRFNNDTEFASYNPDKYRQIYDNAEGKSAKDKINYIRREQYAAQKEAESNTPHMRYEERKRET